MLLLSHAQITLEKLYDFNYIFKIERYYVIVLKFKRSNEIPLLFKRKKKITYEIFY